MAIQMRRGQYKDLDPDKLLPGEWAVSLDERYVHMCFAPGVIMRMATYDAFEMDVAEIQKILEECRSIEEAAERIQTQIGQEVEVITETVKTAQNAANSVSQKAAEAAGSAEEAGLSADLAGQKANEAKTSADTADASRVQAESYSQAAAGSAQNALDSANTAGEKAFEASRLASNAAESADNAEASSANASNSALEAESYAHGGTGIREGEDTDNALFYKEQAKSEADRAKAEADRASDIVGIGMATTDKAGIVKPDGTTILVDEDGTLHSQGGSAGTKDYNELENRPSINGEILEGNKTLKELGIQPKGNYLTNVPEEYITMEELSEKGYLTEETDPTVPAWAKQPEKPGYSKEEVGLGNVPDVATNDQTPTFTQAATRTNISSGEKLSVLFGKIKKWFADLKTVAFSGSYNDLSDKPGIPTKTSQLTNDSGFKTTDTTYSTMTGATASTAGESGLVPAPTAGAQSKFLRGDGTWQPAPAAVTPTNNLLATTPGTPLDAVQGKVLDDKISALNNSFLQNIVALDVSAELKNSVATVINENIKSTSKIFVTRKHSSNVKNGLWAASAYDGYATISCSIENTNGTVQAYILIVNDE